MEFSRNVGGIKSIAYSPMEKSLLKTIDDNKQKISLLEKKIDYCEKKIKELEKRIDRW